MHQKSFTNGYAQGELRRNVSQCHLGIHSIDN